MQIEFSTLWISSFKVRSLIEKERGPENWNGNIWEDPSEAGYSEPLNSAESSLPAEAILFLSEEVKSALSEEAIMANPEVVALKDTLIPLRNYLHHSFLLMDL